MNSGSNTKKITFGAMMVILTVLTLYSTSLLPFNKLFLLGLSSFFITIVVIHHGKRQGLLVYTASSLLSLMVIPNKAIALAYVLFFGYYGVLKSFIEGVNNLFIEWVLKLLCFHIALVAIYLLASKLFFEEITLALPLGALILAMAGLFIFYDYILSRAIQYYNHRRKK
ncbi:hypothetical protein NSA47_05165 [Irregularibacter muris]|uniref:DUF2232 domain-containing protein n=1 Tax=Irregularibacter muris TaxID=1796619 RepID=A0AAE3HFX1_9FIRM|nr:hypothetical protein [Irregularibacter muris]MCR1898378.1 hypothetical protein [Irregularibacter muris]